VKVLLEKREDNIYWITQTASLKAERSVAREAFRDATLKISPPYSNSWYHFC